jgi:ribosomal protein S18 acetylase RimI-like enzyme
MLTFNRIQAQLRASAHQNYAAVAAPPFTYFFNPDDPSPWSNYAIPDASVAGDLTAALTALVAAFHARERLPRFEFVEEFAPHLAPALTAYGFVEEMRALLMACTPNAYQPAAPIPGVTVKELTASAPLSAIQAFLTVQRRGFGDEAASAVTATDAQQFRARFQTMRLFAAYAGEQMVSAGSLQSAHSGVTEIAGIATLRPFRRQGIGTLLTAYAAQSAFAQGLEAVFLTAGSAEAGRVYERVGFQTIGSGLAYSLPEVV